MNKKINTKNPASDFSIPITYPAGRRLANTSVRAHGHDFTELILVTQGQCLVKIEVKSGRKMKEKNIEVFPGDLLIIPPHLSHTQIEKGYVGTSYIGFEHKPEAFNCRFRVVCVKNDLYIARWMDDIIDLHTTIHNNEQNSAIAASLLKAVATRIEQIEHHQKDVLMIHPAVQKSIEFIHSQLTKTISVDQISEHADMSSSYLTKLFKQTFGCGPIHYQQQQRMHLACRHLLNPYITVTQVAQKCGYGNVNFFIRVFKQNYKISPSKWRQSFAENYQFDT